MCLQHVGALWITQKRQNYNEIRLHGGETVQKKTKIMQNEIPQKLSTPVWNSHAKRIDDTIRFE